MKRGPADLTELKITLTQAQCDALAAGAKAEGRSFFDHCRFLLLDGMTAPAPIEAHKAPIAKPAEESRIDRLETMMMQMAETIQNLANPRHLVEAHAAAEPAGTQDDFDTIMRNRLAEAESQGLTAPRAAPEAQAPEDEDYRVIGVRRFNRPAPPNFSSLGSSGRIQREGTPTAGA